MPSIARASGFMARADEDKIYGYRAVRAAFDRRAEAIVRIYVDDARVDDYSELLHDAAQRRIAYKIVSFDEVAAFAGSCHHEGICILAKPRRVDLSTAIERVGESPCVLALDRVQNPHNLGAVARSAAHFGVKAIVRDVEDGRWTAAAFRTAEGGAEFIARVVVDDLADGLFAMRDAGYSVLGLDSEARSSLYDVGLTGPVVLVLGNETHGLRREVRAALSKTVYLPGTDRVQSLNVSNAAAVAMAEVWRQRS
ncbi:MAG: RNA methyltransferase [Myxococcota bacterium]